VAEIIRIDDFNSRLLDPYVRLTGAEMRSKLEPERAIFIAESPTVIEVALDAGCVPVSLLCDERLLGGDVEKIIKRLEDYPTPTGRGVPIYVGKTEMLRNITGFELTRGALCEMRRPAPTPLESILESSSSTAIHEQIADAANVGAIIRTAAALGIDAVLLTPTCCDPYSRRAVRVSMGCALMLPHARIGEGTEWYETGLPILRKYGFTTVAMALTDASVTPEDEKVKSAEKLAIILGTEGTGLMQETVDACDLTVKIPMTRGVDSLNVGAAAAIAFYTMKQGEK
jgi:tRNA G18 (ribose-2'-O)-methylase SpoU